MIAFLCRSLCLASAILGLLSPFAGAAPLTRFVWSGAVTADSARIKAGMLANATQVRAQISESSTFNTWTTTPAVSASLAVADGVADLAVTGLNANTAYYYRIEADGQTDDRVGRFTTFTNGPLSFTFAASACAAQGSTDTVFLAIRDENPLFFLHTGDLHYLNIAENDVNVFYNGYRQVLASSTQRALYESAPLMYIWDDHDYGPNNSDSSSPSRTASRLAYRDYVPHYPLPAGAGDAPIQQSFSVGRVKFIMTDLRSEKAVPTLPASSTKRTMSLAQQQWFFNELLDGRDNYAVVVWVSSYPWIGAGSNGSDFWNGYTHHRDEVAGFIKQNQIRNLCMIAGDAHMLAIDDGTNNRYPDNQPGFPVFQAAALTSSGSVKGGPYTSGTFPGNGQYGLMRVVDVGGGTVGVRWEGKHKDGTVLISHDFNVDASHLLPEFSISGTVTVDGQALAGVTISSGVLSALTDAAGNYSLPVPAGTFEIQAAKPGYEFTPSSQTVEIIDEDVGGRDFIGTALPVFAVTYSAGPGGSIAGVANQSVPQGANASPVTAQPAAGFGFLRWTDGLTTANRSDSSLSGPLHVTALFSRVSLQRDVLLQYDFNEAANTGLTATQPTIGTSTWNTGITNLSTNGAGLLRNTASTATGATNASIGSTLAPGIYEIVLQGVTFANLSGTAAEYVGFSFRTTVTGSELGTSSRDNMWLRVGNLDGQGDGLDAKFGRDIADTTNQINDFAPQGTLDLITRYNTSTGSATFYYDAGSGSIEIASRTGGNTSAALQNIGYGHAVTVNSGDMISVDRLSLIRETGSGPTPPTYAGWAGANGIDGEPPEGDFDGDGISNLLEYALDGLDPAIADHAVGSLDGLLLSYAKRPEAVQNNDVVYLIESSADLGIELPWIAVTPEDDDDQIISFRFSGTERDFARLRVSLIPPAP